MLVEGIHGIQGIRFFELTEVVVDRVEDVATAFEAVVVDAIWHIEVADLEIFAVGVCSNGKGAISGRKVS